MFNAIILALLTFTPLQVSGQPPNQPQIMETIHTLENTVYFFSDKYSVDPMLILNMIKCESKGNPQAIGDSGLAKGIMQYHTETFIRHSKEFGEVLDINSQYDQIKLAVWAISTNKGNEWTSYRAIKNGGAYSFYSKLLKKNFTVICKIA